MKMSRTFHVAFGLAIAAALCGASAGAQAPGDADAPHYDTDGNLLFPPDYREWVFLTAGLDMAYSGEKKAGDKHVFENVFVPKAAYTYFLKAGTWPDKTMLLMEQRVGATNVSINVQGAVQTKDVQGFLVHVKDIKRFPEGGWMFFGFNAPKQSGKPPEDVKKACIECHVAHAAVDTTFVQFYPTLLQTATDHQTLSPSYIEETSKK
jgi:hypothetical protein